MPETKLISPSLVYSFDMEVSNVYLVYSPMSIPEMRRFLHMLGGEQECGPMKIEYDKEGNDTGRTILICSPALYRLLEELGFTQFRPNNYFRIVPYVIPKDFRLKDGLTPELFLSCTQALTLEEWSKKVWTLFQEMRRFGLLHSTSDWSCKLLNPMKSARFSYQCVISFHPKTSLGSIYILKSFLDRAFWYGEESHEVVQIRSYWLRSYSNPL